MMKVIEQKIKKKTVLFEDLEIGDVYRDEVGFVCIKISNKDDEEYNSLICGWAEEGHWSPIFESDNTEVEPLEADLVIK